MTCRSATGGGSVTAPEAKALGIRLSKAAAGILLALLSTLEHECERAEARAEKAEKERDEAKRINEFDIGVANAELQSRVKELEAALRDVSGPVSQGLVATMRRNA